MWNCDVSDKEIPIHTVKTIITVHFIFNTLVFTNKCKKCSAIWCQIDTKSSKWFYNAVSVHFTCLVRQCASKSGWMSVWVWRCTEEQRGDRQSLSGFVELFHRECLFTHVGRSKEDWSKSWFKNFFWVKNIKFLWGEGPHTACGINNLALNSMKLLHLQ